jgi:hypothetical protein
MSELPIKSRVDVRVTSNTEDPWEPRFDNEGKFRNGIDAA